MSDLISYSDFWSEDYDMDWDFSEDSSIDISSSQSESTSKLIRLSAARRAISNYVSILTNKTIPVLFNSSGNNMTDGNTVYIGADVDDKKKFDVSIGLALHEGSHICYSDFELFKTIWTNIPSEIYESGKKLNMAKIEIADLLKTVTNIVEDRYIDYVVYYSAPGYRGYYQALYDKYFNAKVVDDGLKSEMYRVPSIESYLFRIINITNKNTDLNALPDLSKIAKTLNLSNIQRLKEPIDRFNVACEITNIIFKSVKDSSTKKQNESSSSENDNNDDKDKSELSDTFSIFENLKNDSDDIFGGDTVSVNTVEDADNISDIGNDPSISKTKKNKIIKAYSKQKDFVSGNLRKKKVSKKENEILDVLEKSKIDLVDVGQTYISETYNIPKGSVECILVKNMTKELVLSQDFPLTKRNYYILNRDHNKNNFSTQNMRLTSVINEGIVMGIKLGKRLQFRNEINVEKFTRRDIGKIDKRLINELGYDVENIFYNKIISKYKKMNFHISIDASSSMTGKKWDKTIKLTTAIAKAASMLENIRVSISFRTTYDKNPYVVVAYDSDKDKFSKIRNLFCYLNPTATTPEGLAFEATLKVLPKTHPEAENYFINISDGEPNFCFQENETKSSLAYGGMPAAKHTKNQCMKIRKAGYKIISYFVTENHNDYSNVPCYGGHSARDLFKQMYGQDAIFTNVENLNQIVTTLNKKLLESIDI